MENQILKTALLQSLKYLGLKNSASLSNETLIGNIKSILSSFKLVETKEIFESDFIKVKFVPFFYEYKEAINLAKLIFKQLGYSLQARDSQTKIKIPPFFINMPELFERYIEVKLREKYKTNVIPGYDKKSKNKNSYIWGLRPDFIIKDSNMILDAKYKYWFENNSNENFKNDFQQLSLYGRIEKLKTEITTKDNEEPKIIFIYPCTKGTNEIEIEDAESINGFSNIFKISIKIPSKDINALYNNA